jgi:hypothetical protein
MTQGVQVINTGTASATNSISIDWIQFNNIDQVELTNGCTGEPLAIQGNLPATQVDRGNPIKVGAVYSGTLPTYLASGRLSRKACRYSELSGSDLFGFDAQSCCCNHRHRPLYDHRICDKDCYHQKDRDFGNTDDSRRWRDRIA